MIVVLTGQTNIAAPLALLRISRPDRCYLHRSTTAVTAKRGTRAGAARHATVPARWLRYMYRLRYAPVSTTNPENFVASMIDSAADRSGPSLTLSLLVLASDMVHWLDLRNAHVTLRVRTDDAPP
jgi:hypothetical protein